MAVHENIHDYLSFSIDLVGGLAERHGLELTKHDRSGMGEWFVYFESSEFILSIWQDRIGYVSVDVGAKTKKANGMRSRGPWSMAHLRGFLGGGRDHFQFESAQEEVGWLEENEDRIFDEAFLNSDELKRWSVKASRRLFGEGKH